MAGWKVWVVGWAGGQMGMGVRRTGVGGAREGGVSTSERDHIILRSTSTFFRGGLGCRSCVASWWIGCGGVGVGLLVDGGGGVWV